MKAIKEMKDYLFEEDKADLKARDIQPEEVKDTSSDGRLILDTLIEGELTSVAKYKSSQMVLTSAVTTVQLDLSDVRKIKMRCVCDGESIDRKSKG